MQKQHTIIAGQVLQYRDKLYAKRHIIPSELKDKWRSLMKEADKLAPTINPNTRKKTISFQGTLTDLKNLLTAMTNMNNQVVS